MNQDRQSGAGGSVDHYREEDLFPEFAAAAKMDEVRPGRTVRVLVLEPLKIWSHSESPVTVFLVHGANARMAQFYPVAQLLQQRRYRVVAFDAVGGGRTEKLRDAAAYATDEYKLDFEVLFSKYADPEGKNLVVGHSFGTVLSVHIAAKEPEKVGALMLLSSAKHVPKGGHPILQLPEWFLSLTFMRKLLGNGFRAKAFHPSADQQLHTDHELMGKNNPIFAVKAFASALEWMDEDMIKKVKQPVHLMHGSEDNLLKLSNAQQLLPLFAPQQPKMTVLEGAGHMIIMEKPKEVADEIHAFASAALR
eukprot:CAMPEP_0181321996 /NCGR_PEP_ID=MMETSP1101-20121128/18992_1 /TAXON_ID=46948 /ORGANISM="Rhodomonas abbreviata, Strain Caron Lab Isolate" /LENGTH=305 /DNA_ID=CAMNT_0023429879 /DNA_START=189 /DNA_END=1106 /DNA_ORIENTATION=+